MGYDMYWLRSPDGEAEAEAAADKVFRAACDIRDALPRGSAEHEAAQEQVTAAYNAMMDARKSYFRLNIWGMDTVRDAMLAVGMAYDGQGLQTEWPNLSEGFYESEDREKEFPKESQELNERLSWSERPVTDGISLHKFGSNDGWIVTPDECRAAVALVERRRQEGPKQYGVDLISAGIVNEGWLETWNNWIQWVSDAAEHGGFTVN